MLDPLQDAYGSRLELICSPGTSFSDDSDRESVQKELQLKAKRAQLNCIWPWSLLFRSGRTLSLNVLLD